MSVLNPLKKHNTAFPLTVPGSFRAWSQWANTQGCGCLQVHAVKSAFDGREATESDAMMVALCEVYSRAVNETAIALHFDRTDSRVDVHVAQQISDFWSWDIACLVHSQCAAVGPVARDWESVIRLAAELLAESDRALAPALPGQ